MPRTLEDCILHYAKYVLIQNCRAKEIERTIKFGNLK